MSYAVVLYFDYESSDRIYAVKQLLTDNGIKINEIAKPHISLAIYDDIDEQELIAKIKEFTRRRIDLFLTLSYIGIFPSNENAVFLAPKVTQNLLDFHFEFLQFMSGLKSKLNAYYDVTAWVPHCTIGMNITDTELSKAVTILKDNAKLPIEGRLDRIAIVKFPPTEEKFVTGFSAV